MRAVKLLKCKNTFFSNYSLLSVYVKMIIFKLKFRDNTCLKVKNRLMMCISNFSIHLVGVIELCPSLASSISLQNSVRVRLGATT